MLQDLRQKLPQQIPLSMTALASFCVGDRWLDDLPVDEAVPMIFRMGPDDQRIKNMLANGYDFREPLAGEVMELPWMNLSPTASMTAGGSTFSTLAHGLGRSTPLSRKEG